MESDLRSLIRAHPELYLIPVAAVGLGVVATIKRMFASNAETWPTLSTRIENVFVDVSSSGPSHQPQTNAVLAYAYSVGGHYYSGEIRLLAGEASLERLDKQMVGKEVVVHYDPEQPDISIFMEKEVHGWAVVRDRRISMWTWMGFS